MAFEAGEREREVDVTTIIIYAVWQQLVLAF